GVHTACVPVLQRDDLEVRAVTDVDLHGLGQCHAAAVVQHHDRLAAGLGIDGDVLGRRAVIRAGHGHVSLTAGDVILGDGDHQCLLEGFPGDGGKPVPRGACGAEPFVVAAYPLDLDLVVRSDLGAGRRT